LPPSEKLISTMRPEISGRSMTEFSERNVPTADTERAILTRCTSAISTAVPAGVPAGAGVAAAGAAATELAGARPAALDGGKPCPEYHRAPAKPTPAPTARTTSKPGRDSFMRVIAAAPRRP